MKDEQGTGAFPALDSAEVSKAGQGFEARIPPACSLNCREQYFPQALHIGLHYHRRFQLTCVMTDDDERELQAELARLQQEHRDLDAAIDALHQSPAPDLLRLQRMKKRKLLLRDRIAFIEDQITPDIIA